MKQTRKSWWGYAIAAVSALLLVFYLVLGGGDSQLEYVIKSPVSVEHPSFPKLVGDLLDPAFRDGNSVRTLLNGDQIFPPMLEAIRSAKHSISFESYIYWSGDIGLQFAQALGERAAAGVNVHVLLDWAGSGKIDKSYVEMMEKAGVQVQRFHPPRWFNFFKMNNRTHRKVLVVDGKVGFTGGVGIADEWRGNGLSPKQWRDTHYRVEGPVVNQMQSAFMDNWLKVQPEVHATAEYFPALAPAGGLKAQMFISSSDEGGSSVRILYLMAIAGARRNIKLESAYFVPDEHTVKALLEARKRGVDIQILVPGPYVDSKVVRHASRELWGPLLKAGVQIAEYQPALFHCKVMIVDDFFVSVGSTNFDERSFRLNDEANLNILNREFAFEQGKIFRDDWRNSKIVELSQWEGRPLKEKVLEKLASIFSGQL